MFDNAINSIKLYGNGALKKIGAKKPESKLQSKTTETAQQTPKVANPIVNNTTINTKLTQSEQEKYSAILHLMKDYGATPASKGLTPNQQMNMLLKNGKLLSRNSNDKSSVLDNLYEITTKERAQGLETKKVIASTLDAICSPCVITQQFGDISQRDKEIILNNLPEDSKAKDPQNSIDIDKNGSGCCAAASLEVNMADKYPAEFARWVSGLSSKEKEVHSNIKLSSLSKNQLEAIQILNLMKIDKKNNGFRSADVVIKADDNAYIRAQNQDLHWDNGERSIADVLVQSAIMQTGSQNTYDSLTDMREGEFSSQPQGLIEMEKTFVESLIKNKEITSVVHQQIDDNKRLVGYNFPHEKIMGYIKTAIDSGDDVVMGYTDAKADIQESGQNTIIRGHEITIVGYKEDEKGNTDFICVDTDDSSPEYIVKSADWLIPRLHHAGFDARIVEKDMLALENAQVA